MPSVFIPKPQFPTVPALPGVPQLVRQSLLSAQAALLPIQAVLDTGLLIKELALLAASRPQTWGVFDSNGNKVIDPDSIFAFSDRAEWRLLDYPVEDGAFGTFNKVIVPFENSVRMNKGGSLSDREEFLTSIDNIAGDTNIYQIRTPEKSYLSVNIMRRELIRRSSEGAYFLEVDLTFRQIQQRTPQYSSTSTNTANAQNPAAVPPVNQGNVQLVPLTSAASSTSAQAAAAIAQAPF